MDTFNKLLAFFGLVKISRAKQLTARMHGYYVQTVVHGVMADFGASPSNLFISDAEAWWSNEFDRILANQSDDVEIITEPKFKDFA